MSNNFDNRKDSKLRKEILKTGLKVLVGAAVISAGLYWWYKYTASQKDAVGSIVDGGPTAGAAGGQHAEELPPNIDLPKAEVLEMMDKVIVTQHKLRDVMTEVVDLMIEGKLVGIKSIYEHLYRNEPEDPLKAFGITMATFDAVLNAWSEDPEVHDRTMTIVNGPPSDGKGADGPPRDFEVAELIAMHKEILDRLSRAAAELQCLEKAIEADSTSGVKYDPRTANLTLQAIVGGFTVSMFGISAEVLERALIRYQDLLSESTEFLALHQAIQEILDRFE